ncbi:MAG: hypothetical protein ACFFEF_15285 [Candidatus Thorarchaeota archaeon]
MTDYNLGTLTITSHNADLLAEAFGIAASRMDSVIEVAYDAWEHEDTISESVEYLAKRLKGSEIVIALLQLGRLWEESSGDDEEE